MSNKPTTKQSEPSKEGSAPKSVNFIEDDAISPLPMYVTKTNLSRLFGINTFTVAQRMSPSHALT